MSQSLFSKSYSVVAQDFLAAGEVSSKIKKTLKTIGVDSALIRKISIAAYEAEINMVIHSFGGDMSVDVSTDKVVIVCKDRGPGIKDVDLAMQEGYSTASEEARNMGFGAGMGLPNIRKNTSDLHVDSSEKGTNIVMTFNM